MNKREQFLIYIMQFIGIPYIWGGDNVKVGLDCSGLVQILLSWLHLDPPGDQSAQELYRLFLPTSSALTANDLTCTNTELGQLLFFGESTKKITHVAMALGDSLMIEAGGGGSKCTTAAIANSLSARVRVVPISRRKDLVACLQVTGMELV